MMAVNNFPSSSPQNNSQPAPPPQGSSYFTDQKKGEVNELKQLLKNINIEKDQKKKREIIKKVIAYMTLGIDVSRLFTDMIMAIETKDIVVKKMVYFYLCGYAHKEPDLAIMCINTLRRDCDNDDPMVRGLALRSLCGLRLESVLEYVQQPLQKSLIDVSPYVRKTGVMGILKVNYLSPAVVENNGYVPQLFRMLQDVDAHVVVNTIHVLNELQIADGGITVDQSLMLSLLNRISEFSEWGLNTVLELISKYSPNDEEEAFSIMNLLDPVLRTASSAAVLATFKCFMKFTSAMPDLQPQIISRSKPPILTLVTGNNPEVQYSVLKHLQVILNRNASKGIFDEEYRQFYVRYNEPQYVKHLKVDIMPLLANDINARDIATELSEYVTDVDAELSKRAISSIAEIAMRIRPVSGDMTQVLVSLVDLDMTYVRAEAMKNITNVLRIYPEGKIYILPSLSRCFKRVDDSEARCSLIWILGEYGHEVIEAPYILEPLIDNYEEEDSVDIKLQLLSSTIKLFFKRPPEVKAMLGRLLKYANDDTSNQDIHDRALMYYRLLSSNVSTAQALFQGLGQQSMKAGSSSGGKGYAELRDEEKNSQIFAEFNTLAVVYQMPSQRFIESSYQLHSELSLIPDFDANSPLIPENVVVSQNSLASHNSTSGGSLLDFDDGFASSVPATPIVPSSSLSLKSSAELNPQQYQSMWLSLPDGFNGKLLTIANIPKASADYETQFRQKGIMTMASGPLPPTDPQYPGVKLFLFAVENEDNLLGLGGGALYLVQLLVSERTGDVTVTCKTNSPKKETISDFMNILSSSFNVFGRR